MNRKQLVFLVLVIAIVAGIGLYVHHQQTASWTSGGGGIGKKLIDNFAVNDVADIGIRQGSNEIHLVKKNDLWRVKERGDYPANFSEISGFLLKLNDLKISQVETVGPSQLPQLSLAPGSGPGSPVVVEFKDDKGKTMKTLWLGKKHMRKSDRPSPMAEFGEEGGFPDGRYVKTSADSADVAVINDALANIEPKADQWLDKDFFKIDKVKSIAVTFPEPTNSWKLTRETETGEWKLADAKPTEQLDAGKASGVINPLSSPAFTDVATNSNLAKPTLVNVETFDHFNYALKVGLKFNDTFPLTFSVAADFPKERAPGKDEKPEDKTRLDKEFTDNLKKSQEKLTEDKKFENWVYTVSSWTVEPMLKDRSQLMVEKKEEPKKDEKAAPPPAAPSLAPLPGSP